MQLKQVKHKISSLPELVDRAKQWRDRGETIAFTNGVFDLLHLGHIDYLAKTSDCADRLIVAVNSDASVRGLGKGSTRPIKDEEQRAIILASMQFIDAVIIFGDPTPLHLIEAIKPDVLVKGGDYDPTETDSSSKSYIVGSREVAEWGGQTKVIAFVPGYSTTSIEDKIKQG